ncbi:uncharacterized protein [Macrobrachium rosenbergii]|uniref:uncharacterized protein n=1 Tax=Macrobrachium rosenbergii TaxID=79674 RepID=UPI0034D56A53
MKVALLLLGLAAAVLVQGEPWCRCGVFITFSDEEEMVYAIDDIAIESCDDVAETCKNGCASQINALTNNGDLWYVTPSNVTVGQIICTKLATAHHHHHHYVHNHYAYGYYGVCAGPWEYAEVVTQQMLCCEDGEHAHCIS